MYNHYVIFAVSDILNYSDLPKQMQAIFIYAIKLLHALCIRSVTSKNERKLASLCWCKIWHVKMWSKCLNGVSESL